jgi:hypothetical protein
MMTSGRAAMLSSPPKQGCLGCAVIYLIRTARYFATKQPLLIARSSHLKGVLSDFESIMLM